MNELVMSARRITVPTKYRAVIDLAEQFPFVDLHRSTWCDGWTTQDKDGTKVRRKCQRRAYWKYKAGKTKKPHAKSGIYCWYHLLNDGITGTKYDRDRARRAEKKVKQNAIQE